MALEDWAKYFRMPPERRRKLLNVVSLSLAGTPLEVDLGFTLQNFDKTCVSAEVAMSCGVPWPGGHAPGGGRSALPTAQ